MPKEMEKVKDLIHTRKMVFLFLLIYKKIICNFYTNAYLVNKKESTYIHILI